MAGLKDVTDIVALSIAHYCHVGVCEIAAYCSQLSMLAVAGVYLPHRQIHSGPG